MRRILVNLFSIAALVSSQVGSVHCDAPEHGPPPRLVDQNGESLPPGAIARLGTNAFRHSGSVSAAAVSPDGRLIATAADGRAIYLWDAATGRRLREIATESWRCPALAFSPDSRTVAAAGDPAALYDVVTGRKLARVQDQEESYVALVFSPDGKSLALGTAGHSVSRADGRYDVLSGVLLVGVPNGRKIRRLGVQEGMVEGVAFSPDGTAVASASRDNTIRLWQPETGKERRRLQASDSAQTRVAFSSDSKRLASSDWNGDVTVWDPTTRVKLWQAAAERHPLGSLAFSPDGSTIVAGADYSPVRLLDARTGKLLDGLRGLEGLAHHAAFTPDGKSVVAWGGDHLIHVWDPATDRERLFGSGHRKSVGAVAVSVDGRRVASAALDGIRLWDLEPGREVRRFADGEFCDAVAFSPDGKVLAGVHKRSVTLWDSATGGIKLNLQSEGRNVTGVAFAPDGKAFYTADFDSIEQWDVKSGKRLRRFEVRPSEPYDGFSRLPPPLSNLTVSPDGSTVCVADVAKVRLWNVGTGKEDLRLAENLTSPVAFSPGGRLMVCDRGNDDVCFWDVASAKEVGSVKLGIGQARHSFAFAPDGRAVAAACDDGVVRVWSCPGGVELAAFRGHRGSPSCVAYTPDGKALVSGGYDTTILVWDLGMSGRRQQQGNRQTPGK